MDILYINLDSALERKTQLEESFKTHHTNNFNFNLHRFAAISALNLPASNTNTSLSESEHACFLSHQAAIAKGLSKGETFWVMEDDSTFAQHSFKAVDTYINLFKDADWDILFTAIDSSTANKMFELFYFKYQLEKNRFTTLNLEQIPFASASSYIVNHNKREHIENTLLNESPQNLAWDIFLSDCISNKKLKAFVLIPYATGLSKLSLDSQIRNSHANPSISLLYLFRKLMESDADIAEINRLLAELDSEFYDESILCFSKIIAGIISKKFKPV